MWIVNECISRLLTDEFCCLLITVCPIEGQIYYPGCAPCDGTCEDPDPLCPRNLIICNGRCEKTCEPGCACPKGQVIKDRKCVDKTECPPPPGDTSVYE